ncbi:hypothetical protein K491DRAFT_76481 [Lophiostoma macrostomum CBS 122681]|uniref:Xylanolytic transcriptional activator regulatory domain-containing protein n=1 Tax=Lophiostoma macrostomum CBS 122681 TaxID=1314788 RepID=A0A6A6SZ07_9PLEO|nr:hypothetical protein K491DRAFT_76481 [Lophiostoma macrostomum CBS 122681]
MWFDEPELERGGYQFFLFQENTPCWVDSFAAALEGGYPKLPSAPPEVLENLRNCQPHLIQDRAWVLMYYSMVLSQVSNKDSDRHSIKKKLRRNIWLTLHDARLLLEPSELHITALTLLACNAEEFTTPSLCWMLAATACRMLQALGINQKRLDPETRQRRKMMFWHLNLLDKGLSIIFGRPPTFHRAMAKEIGMPSLEQLMASQPRGMSSGAPRLFGTHYFHQRLLLTQVMGDVWNCLYEDAEPDVQRIERVSRDVDGWYQRARTVLDASAISEKPFLEPAGAASIDIALHCLDFLHHYIQVMLYRAYPGTRSNCVMSSKAMLRVLEHLVSDGDEPYMLSVWQLLCCPFTPFLELFSEILSNGQGASEGNQETLATMQLLLTYLHTMSPSHTLATKLERIAEVFVRQAEAVIDPQAIKSIY